MVLRINNGIMYPCNAEFELLSNDKHPDYPTKFNISMCKCDLTFDRVTDVTRFGELDELELN
jgi:hypothetical protein